MLSIILMTFYECIISGFWREFFEKAKLKPREIDHCLPKFLENEADEDSLPLITDEHLISMGIEAICTRSKIMKQIKLIVRKASVPEMYFLFSHWFLMVPSLFNCR